MRTYSAYGGGDRYLLLYDADGLAVVAESYLLNVSLNVGMCRAVERARALAVPVVVAKYELKGDLPGLFCPGAFGIDDHSVGKRRGTGAQKFRHALCLDHAEPAGAVDLQLLVVAHVRDLYPVAERGG